MSILILAIIAIICVVLLCWGIDQVPQFAPFSGILKLLVIVVGVLFIISKSGVL